ncbi:hypothetical protein NS506_02219 [Nocardia seriolae]|uniref:Uncharacterized protein n=1 Tax=Nocardia seriolae TaxID=37332 RepID=A0ABC9Z288_9NOCA|nr:hypothetical protein NS506_02219 [Nocardia seriolae]BEK98390.1 hypothetical protein NSER024013_62960 [Nocardia seriolae]GAM49694.1 hypothetical protein NS07_v2contig00119-0011 [Nocardia seriolae]GAP31708.1 hypothetical protein NSK11_contig00124-0010 [Nocardia seriolae]
MLLAPDGTGNIRKNEYTEMRFVVIPVIFNTGSAALSGLFGTGSAAMRGILNTLFTGSFGR